MYLIFDFETTGICSTRNVFTSQRPIELAWQMISDNNKVLSTSTYYISGNPSIDTEFHKHLTVEYLNRHGSSSRKVIELFMKDVATIMQNNGKFVAHNIEFDYTILKNELEHLGITHNYVDHMKYFTNNQICTMKSSVDYCRIPKYTTNEKTLKRQSNGYKYPRLIELYQSIFKREPSFDLHRALNDVIVTTQCFIILKKYAIV